MWSKWKEKLDRQAADNIKAILRDGFDVQKTRYKLYTIECAYAKRQPKPFPEWIRDSVLLDAHATIQAYREMWEEEHKHE